MTFSLQTNLDRCRAVPLEFPTLATVNTAPQFPTGESLGPRDARQRGVSAEGARRGHAVPRGARAAVGGGHVLLGPAAEASTAQPDLRGPGG